MFNYKFWMLPRISMFFDGTGDEPAGGGAAAPVAEDREDRIERATEAFRASGTDTADADKAAADKAAADAAAAGAGGDPDKAAADKKTADDKAAADKVAADAAAAGDDSKLPYFNEPRFQEIYKAHNEQKAQIDAFTGIFTDKEGKLGYTIDSTETLTGVLTDAYSLYDIAGGKKSVAELLTTFEKNWTKEQFGKVMQDMANFAASKGVKVDEKAAADKPWEKEINALKTELGETKKAQEAREQKEKDALEQKTRMDTVVTPTINKVTDLCKAAGLDEKADAEEISDYCNAVSAAIGTDKNKAKILEQLAKGQFGEVERVWTEYHNKLMARAKRLGDTVLKQKLEKDKGIPKVPAGGAAPSKTAATPKRDLTTSEGRTAAAKAEWDKSKTA